jgi:hypothetical protein
VGSRVALVASFIGRRLEYTYGIAELVEGERVVMRTAQGPAPMETTYIWTDAGKRLARMSLRNRGMPAGFSTAFTPFMAFAMRRANRKDLARLKAILEGGAFGENAPSSSRTVVVLPAPLGPSSAVTRPASSCRLNPWTAVTSRYRFVTSSSSPTIDCASLPGATMACWS